MLHLVGRAQLNLLLVNQLKMQSGPSCVCAVSSAVKFPHPQAPPILRFTVFFTHAPILAVRSPSHAGSADDLDPIAAARLVIGQLFKSAPLKPVRKAIFEKRQRSSHELLCK